MGKNRLPQKCLSIWIKMFSISLAYAGVLKDIFITYVKYRDLTFSTKEVSRQAFFL